MPVKKTSVMGNERCRLWLESKLGERLPDDMWEWAHDGKRLCALCNILRPGTIDMAKLNKRNGPMFHMQNIDFAMEGFKVIFPAKHRTKVFRSLDLYEKRAQYPSGMWICLETLMRLDKQATMLGPGFGVPT